MESPGVAAGDGRGGAGAALGALGRDADVAAGMPAGVVGLGVTDDAAVVVAWLPEARTAEAAGGAFKCMATKSVRMPWSEGIRSSCVASALASGTRYWAFPAKSGIRRESGDEGQAREPQADNHNRSMDRARKVPN
jgi:hypothetical protein